MMLGVGPCVRASTMQTRHRLYCTEKHGIGLLDVPVRSAGVPGNGKADYPCVKKTVDLGAGSSPKMTLGSLLANSS